MDSSFDVTSRINQMELANAINQAIREVGARYDFKNTETKIELTDDKIALVSQTEERVKAALEVVKEKMIKRGISLKHLDIGLVQLSGKNHKLDCVLREGISTENAKLIVKLIKEHGPKSNKTQIQGDELRVSSKSRDDLQVTIQLIKDGGFDFAIQFTNYK